MQYFSYKQPDFISNRNIKKLESESYKLGKKNAIAKRRARNRMARKSRRINQIRLSK